MDSAKTKFLRTSAVNPPFSTRTGDILFPGRILPDDIQSREIVCFIMITYEHARTRTSQHSVRFRIPEFHPPPPGGAMCWVSAEIVEFREIDGIPEFHAPPAPLAPPWGAGRDMGPAPGRGGTPGVRNPPWVHGIPEFL